MAHSAQTVRLRNVVGALLSLVALTMVASAPLAHASAPPPPASFDAPPLSSIAAPGVEQAGVNSLAQGDFDGNGTPDFAGVALGGAVSGVTDRTGVLVFLGRVEGTFATPVEYPAGAYPIQVVTARLRGATAPLDLVVLDAGLDTAGHQTISVLLGNGDGTFGSPSALPFPPPAIGSIAIGDVNGDGKPDLVVSTHTGPTASGSVPQDVTILLGNGDGTFGPPTSYSAGDGLSPDAQMIVADVNHDGKPDILGMDSDGLWLSLGNGDGSFQPAAIVWEDPVGGEHLGGPASLVTGDFTGSGNVDVALNVGGVRVDVLRNSGAGIFAPFGEYDVSQAQAGFGGGTIEAADLRGDGKLDLVMATGFGATLAVLRGNGDGTFQTPVIYPLPSFDDGSMLMAAVAGDRLPDIVVATGIGGLDGDVNYLTTLRNRGDGTFVAPKQFPVVAAYDNQTANPTNPVGVTLGDFNGDGKLDLAVTEWDVPVEPLSNGQLPSLPTINTTAGTVDAGGSVAILMGNGDGTFGTETQYHVGGRPIAIAARDLTGDGHQDLVVANAFSNTLSLLEGNGDGTFQAAVTIPVGTTPNALALGDFSGDGRPDIAVTTLGDNSVSLLINQSTSGHLAFATPVSYPTGTGPDAVVAGDFTGDGRLDLAVSGDGVIYPPTASTLTVLTGNGDGTFHALPSQTLWPGPGANALAAADLTGDGKLDLAVTNFQLDSVQVLRGQGDGTFVATGNYTVGAGPESIIAADFNGDGTPDLAVGDLNDGTVAMLLGNGDGSFATAADRGDATPRPFGWPVFAYPTFLAAGDLTGQGRPDLVTANIFNATVTVLLNTTPPAPQPSIREAPAAALLGLAGAVGLAGSAARRRRRSLGPQQSDETC